MQNASTELAYINPKVLSWAIKRSGIDRVEIAKRIGVTPDLLSAWESPGGAKPIWDKALRIADVLQVPFGYLFSSTLPKTELDVDDFRKRGPAVADSPSFHQLVSEVLSRRDWFRAFVDDGGGSPLPFVGSFTIRNNPQEVANDIREKIGLTGQFRHSAGNWSNYLTALVHKAEDIGILVMRTGIAGHDNRHKISPDEFQAFALSDKLAPVIVINSSDTRAAQVFSFAHELAHIWLGVSGISNSSEGQESNNQIEEFCNTVAANLLAPRVAFLNSWRDGGRDRVERVAKEFWVSQLVVLRRAKELGEITVEEFNSLRKLAIAKQKKPNKDSGPTYYAAATVRMGYKFTFTLLHEVRVGRVGHREASRLMSMKVGTVRKFAERTS